MSKQAMMFQHVENWKRSGLTQATYCEGQNLKAPTFSYWVIKYQRQNIHLDSESAFITIEKQAALKTEGYEIVYPNGVILRITTSNLSELSTLAD